MAVDYVDYDVLEQGKTDYANQASAISTVIASIKRMNSDLMQGWNNETARAFLDRINSDHIPKLEKASAAIQEVSDYIQAYLKDKQEYDAQGAGAVSIG